MQIKAGPEVTKKIDELQVDGDLLLLLTEKNLQLDLGVDNAITRKRFEFCVYLYSLFLSYFVPGDLSSENKDNFLRFNSKVWYSCPRLMAWLF